MLEYIHAVISPDSWPTSNAYLSYTFLGKNLTEVAEGTLLVGNSLCSGLSKVVIPCQTLIDYYFSREAVAKSRSS